MKLSVPFIPDTAFAKALAQKKADLASAYFCLPPGPVLNARVQSKPMYPSIFVKILGRVTGIKAYCLLNSRFVRPDFLGTLANCDKFCKKCGICRKLFTHAGRKQPLTIKPYKDKQ